MHWRVAYTWKIMNSIKGWMQKHPYQNTIFTFWLTAMAAAGAYDDGWRVTCAVLYLLGVFSWSVSHAVYTVSKLPPKHMTILLVLALLSSSINARADEPQRTPPEAASIGAGVVVLCIGGYCVYRIFKFCQKAFPKKDTNAPPEFMLTGAAGGDEYGGSWSYDALGSCYTPPPNDVRSLIPGMESPTTATINVLVEHGGTKTQVIVSRNPLNAQTLEEFQAEAVAHGLLVSIHADGSQYFSRNRQRVEPGTVPISFDPFSRTVRTGTGETRRIVVERSIDLVAWSSFLVTEVAVGSGFTIIDTSLDGHMFYRVL